MMTMRARTPEDLLAAVPVMLGFHPTESIVMLTFGGQHAFHARIDLPQREAEESRECWHHVLDEAAAHLIRPAVRERARAVVLLLYTDRAEVVETVGDHLTRRCARAGVEVIELLWISAGHYAARHRGRFADQRTAFDISTHPFLAQAVVAGVVTERSREDLVARVAADPVQVNLVEGRGRPGTLGGPPVLDGAGLRDLLEAHAGARTLLDPAEAAAVIWAIADPSVRDAAWWGISRIHAERHSEIWIDLLRRSPQARVPDVAGVAAALCWLAGNGALAWCALDRGHEVEATHPLLRVVSRLLTDGVPPIQDWTRPWGETG